MTDRSLPCRDAMVEALIPLAARLAGAVHDDGPAVVAEIIGRVPAGQLDALCVVLAAMVPTERTVPELLGWLDALPAAAHPEFAALAAVCRASLDGSGDRDARVAARRDAVRRMAATGMTSTAIAEHLGIDRSTVDRYHRADAASTVRGAA